MAVNIQCTQAAMSTSSGTQDITISGFGTPKAAIIYATSGTANGTGVNDGAMCVGFTDGTIGRYWYYFSDDNTGAVDSQALTAGIDTSQIVSLTHNGSTFSNATFNQWVTDGIQLNWSIGANAAYLMNVILIGGSDVSADVAGVTISTEDTEVDVTSPGFQPDLVIATAANFSGSNEAHVTMGVSDGTNQRCWSMFDKDTSDPSDVRGILNTNYALDYISDTAAYDFSVDISNFDASGYSCYARRANGTGTVMCMALNFNSAASVEIGTYTTPTSTGSDSVSSLSITPDFLLLGTSFLTAVDSEDTSGGGGSVGLWISDDANEYHSSVNAEDGQTRSDTKSLTDNNLNQNDHSGANPFTATLTGFDSNGWTFNYSAVNSTARKCWYVAIGNPPAPATVKQSGGDYTTLNGAFTASETLIEVQGTWTSADTTSATCSTANTIVTADADSKHSGYIESSPSYYRLETTSTETLYINEVDGFSVDGIVIKSDSTTTSAEGVRFNAGTTSSLSFTLKNCIIYGKETATQDADGIFMTSMQNGCVANIEQCKVYHWGRSAIQWTSSTASALHTVNVNSCTIYAPQQHVSSDSGGGLSSGAAKTSSAVTTINANNCIVVGCPSGANQNDVYEDATDVDNWNLSYCIDSDGSIAKHLTTGSGNILNATATDDASPGFKPAVIFNDITTYPYDLRLKKAAR